MGAEELEFCQGHVEWEEHVGLSRRRCPGGNEIYKSQSSEVGSGESLAKNVRDMGAKPGEEGVSESPGGGGGNCKLHILLLTHTYTHTEHGSRIWRFPDSISNFSVIQQLIRSWVLKSLGGLRGSQRSLHNPGLPGLTN